MPSSIYTPGRNPYAKLLVILTTALPQLMRVSAAPLMLETNEHDQAPPGSQGTAAALLQHLVIALTNSCADFYFKLGLAAL